MRVAEKAAAATATAAAAAPMRRCPKRKSLFSYSINDSARPVFIDQEFPKS